MGLVHHWRFSIGVTRALVLCAAVLFFTSGCNPSAPSSSPTKNYVADDDSAAASNVEQVHVQQWRVPDKVESRGFVSSEACAKCHTEAYETWHKSYHRTMTQLASPETIVAPFDGRTLELEEVAYRVERRGDEFWVTMPDPDLQHPSRINRGPRGSNAPLVERPVLMRTGSHHLQIYWVPSKLEGNMMHLFPWVYSIDLGRWIPFKDSFVAPPTMDHKPITWNTNCIACHSVDGRPMVDLRRGLLNTEVAELGIACEACHGPGEPHIRWQQSTAEQRGDQLDPVIHPGRCDSKVSAQICGQCHSDFTRDQHYYTHGPTYRAGSDLTKAQHLIGFHERADPRHPFHGSYWDDGTHRIGGREYLGLIASLCFEKGEMSCLTCHSMHQADPNQQLKVVAQSNDVCLDCHQSMRDQIEQHTHHPVGSSGSECYNCHMPRTTYALFRAMRSHRIDNPSVAVSAATGRPNACNLCHLDQSLAWTSNYLQQWYGHAAVELDEQESTLAASVLWLLRGDAAQRVITAWHFGWPEAQAVSGTDWMPPVLAQLLVDSYSVIRLVASQSLKTLPAFTNLNYDYLAELGQLTKTRRHVIEQWYKDESRGRGGAETLQTEEGVFDQDLADRLLRQQDRRPLMLSE